MADEIDGLKSRVPPEFRMGLFPSAELYYGGRWRNGWSDEARWRLPIPVAVRKMKVPLVIGVAHKPVKELRNKVMLTFSHSRLLICAA
jgi:hypothetical protein